MSAVEIVPGDRRVVHHVIVYVIDEGQQAPNGWLGAWAAGHGADGLPGRHRPPAQEGQPPDRQHALPPDRRGGAGRDHPRRLLPRPRARRRSWSTSGCRTRRSRSPPGTPTTRCGRPTPSARTASCTRCCRTCTTAARTSPTPRSTPTVGARSCSRCRPTTSTGRRSTSSPSRSSCPRARASTASPTTTTRPRTRPTPTPPRTSPSATQSFDEMMIGFVDYTVKEGLRPISAEERLTKIRAELASRASGRGVPGTRVGEARAARRPRPTDGATACAAITSRRTPRTPSTPAPAAEGDRSTASDREPTALDTALHFPAAGADGLWFIPFNGDVLEAKLIGVAGHCGGVDRDAVGAVRLAQGRRQGRLRRRRRSPGTLVMGKAELLSFEGSCSRGGSPRSSLAVP